MTLIRILGDQGLTNLFYVKSGADSENSSLIDLSLVKIAIFTYFGSQKGHFSQIFENFNFVTFGLLMMTA